MTEKTEICSLTLACFFITEMDGKNRKKQKFARYAHLLASSVAILIMLADARLSSSLQKKTEKTEKLQKLLPAAGEFNLNANVNQYQR